MKLLLLLIGLAALVLAAMYFTMPAGSLPLPDALGHQAGSPVVHVKHGVAALLLGLACLGLAWRMSSSATR